jgi:aminoglycoside 2'-N-acetyltransferase I
VGIVVREVTTPELRPDELEVLRSLFAAAFRPGGFDDHDFEHALGGRHWLLEADGQIVSHASVVQRELQAAGRPLRTGYLEAVATLPAHQRRGHASRLVALANEHIRSSFELGALSTGVPGFYERLGWLRWLGPTSVRFADGLVPTPDDDDGILILLTPTSPTLDLTAPLSCDWRPGDVW